MNNANDDNLGGTQNQFGYEWSYYKTILPEHKFQFIKWIFPFKIEDFKGKSFIDAGCGIGRNSYWPLLKGAKSCFAFDFDKRTVEVAKSNLVKFDNVKLDYLSIYDLDIDNEYDIAFSIGVIHHLKFPDKAIKNLFKSLKPGGKLILWVYAKEGNEKKLMLIKPLRVLTVNLPLGFTKFISKILSYILWLLLKVYSRSPYFKLMKTFSLIHLESIIFDQLIPSIANYWSKEDALNLVKGLKVKSVDIYHTNKMSWTLICEKSN